MSSIKDVQSVSAGEEPTETMLAVLARRPGGPEVLEVVELPVEQPGPGQVRIRAVASAVHPVDLSARAGRLKEAGLLAAAEDVPLGWDVAGYVEVVGAGVHRFHVGDPVVGLRDLLSAPGAHAERVVLDVDAVAPAPRSVPLERAATLPLNALTADGALAMTGLEAGGSLLVTGAAGEVGSFVLQLAAMRGIRTVAAVRPHGDVERARRLGADHVLTTERPLASSVRSVVPGGVDAVVDAAVLGIGAHDALRSGGTFVALVRPFAPPPIRGTRVIVHEAAANGARLTELAALVDFGAIELRSPLVLPLAEAADAHVLLHSGRLGAPVVLVPGRDHPATQGSEVVAAR